MTKEEILAMEVGEELDEAVERHVFGWKPVFRDGDVQEFYRDSYPPYSTDISAAWLVVEEMVKLPSVKGTPPTLFTLQVGNYPAPWAIAHFDEVEAAGEFAPEAICKAALLAQIDRGQKGD